MIAALRDLQIELGQPVCSSMDDQAIGQQIVKLQKYLATVPDASQSSGFRFDPAKVRSYLADHSLAGAIIALQNTANTPASPGLPIIGDMVFGAQGNTRGFQISSSLTGFQITSGYENLLTETYLPSQPSGWRAIWTASAWGQPSGVAPIEKSLANTSTIMWGSLLSNLAGGSFLGDIAYTQFGTSLPANGGFTFSDPLPAIADGNVARHVIQTPLSQFRLSGYNFTKIGEAQRRSATASTFDTVRNAGLGTSVGSAIFNNEALQMSGILVPMTNGYRSCMGWGTSIEKDQGINYRDLAGSARNAYGYFAEGMDSVTNGRWGWWNASVNGAALSQQDENAAGEFALRYGMLLRIAREINGNRWPLNSVMLDLRNDAVAVNGVSAQDTCDLWLAMLTFEIGKANALFPGVPVYLVDLPPIQPVAAFAPYYCTDTANQIPTAGNYKAAAVLLFNAYVAANYVALGLAGVNKAGSAACAPSDGSGVARWVVSPFNLAGGGTLDVVDYPGGLASATNLATTGVTVTSVAQPEIGNFLVFEAGNAGNAELIQGTNRGEIVSVASAGAGKWLCKIANGSTTKAHAAGTTVLTSQTQDMTHPSHYLQRNDMMTATQTFKGTV
jgi:hypothetical protein